MGTVDAMRGASTGMPDPADTLDQAHTIARNLVQLQETLNKFITSGQRMGMSTRSMGLKSYIDTPTNRHVIDFLRSIRVCINTLNQRMEMEAGTPQSPKERSATPPTDILSDQTDILSQYSDWSTTVYTESEIPSLSEFSTVVERNPPSRRKARREHQHWSNENHSVSNPTDSNGNGSDLESEF